MKYTYDDFQKAVNTSGFSGQFSDRDLRLAQQNPDAGMSILKYKQDYKNATTDEARALANMGAEGVRSSYGGYTGGKSGTNIQLEPLTQSSAAGGKMPYKSRYTYEEFRNAANASGLAGQFSDADLKLAQQNPDAGMSILKYKQDYGNAATDEARALANMGAEEVRRSYGGYTGGTGGDRFHLEPLSPSSFEAAPAPEYTNRYDETIQDLLGQVVNREQYNNRYDGTIQNLLGQIVNRQDFNYDPETDALYSQYRKQYAREGQRATQDALGAAAAASGGIPSSYAATAASQAGDYYASQMTDKIPELYQLAYNKYLNDYNMKLSSLDAVSTAEQNDYTKYLNDYNMKLSDLDAVRNAEQSDYNKYLNTLSQYNTDRNFNYGQLLDEINSQTQRREEKKNNAILAGQYGDYSQLENLGINMDNNPAEYEKKLGQAILAAQYGDYSQLKNMGINTDNNPTDYERRYNEAILAAQYGDFSGLRALGINPDANGLYNFNYTAENGSWGDYSGGYSSGGSGGSGGSGRSGSGSSGGGPATGMTDDAISAIRAAYGTNIDEDTWNSILASNPELTEDMLYQAGFSKGGSSNAEWWTRGPGSMDVIRDSIQAATNAGTINKTSTLQSSILKALQAAKVKK